MNQLRTFFCGITLIVSALSGGCARYTPQTGAQSLNDPDNSPREAESRYATTYAGERIPGQFKVAGGSIDFLAIDRDGDKRQGPEAKAEPVKRQIIFSAEVRLTVQDFAKAEADLLQLVDANKGYTANADVAGTVGGMRQGVWKLRVPLGRFNEFRDAVKKLGELVRYTADSRDVTEEYVDLQIRIKNKEDELESYRKIFQDATKTEDVLKVVTELKRAQDELERMKGRQRLLENLTEFTTFTVHIQERSTFTPPDAPSFGSTVSQTFVASIESLIAFGKALLLAVVAAAPWLPVVALPVAAAWYIIRRRRAVVLPVHANRPA